MARTVPSLEDEVDVGVEPDADPVEVTVLDLDNDELGRTELDTVGRPAKTAELVSDTQLDEAGTRGV
jgi:hypothetical protein